MKNVITNPNHSYASCRAWSVKLLPAGMHVDLHDNSVSRLQVQTKTTRPSRQHEYRNRTVGSIKLLKQRRTIVGFRRSIKSQERISPELEVVSENVHDVGHLEEDENLWVSICQPSLSLSDKHSAYPMASLE